MRLLLGWSLNPSALCALSDACERSRGTKARERETERGTSHLWDSGKRERRKERKQERERGRGEKRRVKERGREVL